MLKKHNRLPIQKFAGSRGRLAKTHYFLVKTFKSDLDFSRFGVTVSAKTARKASRRNTIKRMAYNFFRKENKSLPIADYWVTVLPNAADLPKEKFIAELNRSLK